MRGVVTGPDVPSLAHLGVHARLACTPVALASTGVPLELKLSISMMLVMVMVLVLMLLDDVAFARAAAPCAVIDVSKTKDTLHDAQKLARELILHPHWDLH